MASFEELIDGLPPVFRKSVSLLKRLWNGDDTRETVAKKLTVGSIQLDLTATGAVVQGELKWNEDDETFDFGMNGAVWQGGLENFRHMRNNTGGQIDNGRMVMFTGTLGASGKATLGLMDGTDPANARYAVGVVTYDIANSGEGKVTWNGKVRGIDTSGGLSFGGLETWLDGDILYVDPVNPGYLTNVEPAAEEILMPVAAVLYASATVGLLDIRVTPIDENSTANLKVRNEFKLGTPYWDDLRIPLTQVRQGALLKPDFDETNVGLLFPQNDTSEVAYFIAQLPHAWKAGTEIRPHVHWQQSAATAVTWKLDYKIFNPNELVPAAFTTISGDTPSFSYTSGNLHQITPIGSGIDMTGKTLSAVILGKIYRDDNTTTGDVTGWDIDFHYQIDTLGSRQEFIE